MKRFFLFPLMLLVFQLSSQTPHHHSEQRAIHFPNVPGYQTLACDFHIHTVFSDGSVWPDIRVQ